MVYQYYTKRLAPLKSISCNVPNRPIPLYFAFPNNTQVIAMPMICTCTCKPCLLCSNIFYKANKHGSFIDHMFNSLICILSNYRRANNCCISPRRQCHHLNKLERESRLSSSPPRGEAMFSAIQCLHLPF